MACMAHIDAASLHLSKDSSKMIPKVSSLPQATSLALPPQAAFLASLTRTPKGLQVPWFSWFLVSTDGWSRSRKNVIMMASGQGFESKNFGWLFLRGSLLDCPHCPLSYACYMWAGWVVRNTSGNLKNS